MAITIVCIWSYYITLWNKFLRPVTFLIDTNTIKLQHVYMYFLLNSLSKSFIASFSEVSLQAEFKVFRIEYNILQNLVHQLRASLANKILKTNLNTMYYLFKDNLERSSSYGRVISSK